MPENINNFKEEYLKKDRSARMLSKDGKFRAVCVKSTTSCQTAQKKHSLGPIPAFFLAQSLTAASLVAAFLKGEERIIVEADSDGDITKIYAEAMSNGELRGFIDFKETSSPKKELFDYFGKGTFSVSKILYNRSEPIKGIIELTPGDIATNLTIYFNQSEQVPSVAFIEIDFDESSWLLSSAYGICVQAMPGASDEEILKLAEHLQNNKDIIKSPDQSRTPEELLRAIMPMEMEMLKASLVDFYCRCSKENFIEKLVAFGADEVQDMQKEGSREMVCKFCSTKYVLTEEDFERINEEIKAKKN